MRCNSTTTTSSLWRCLDPYSPGPSRRPSPQADQVRERTLSIDTPEVPGWQLRQYARDFRDHGPEVAADELRKEVDEERVVLIRGMYRREIGKIESHVNLVSADSDDTDPQVNVPTPRWDHVRRQLEAASHLDKGAVAIISEESRVVAAKLAPPRGASIRTRGLVVGHVQSGKTTNFLAVAARAADRGYDLVIVLAGIHNSLRRQTQTRLQDALVHRDELWWSGTETGDFEVVSSSFGSHLHGEGKRGLLVVKKNIHRLTALADWLESSARDLRDISVLVIDDEADQAGLDIAPAGVVEGVHEQVLRLVNASDDRGNPRVAYLGYTATPYANILTSQADDGLYPRDFIFTLSKPPAHVGAREMFGDAAVGQPIRLLPGAMPASDVLTGPLREAIDWFVMSAAARGHLGSGVGSFSATMLIHTSRLTDAHAIYPPVLESHLKELRDGLEDEAFVRRLRGQYATEMGNVDALAMGETPVDFDDLFLHLPDVLGHLLERTPANDPYAEDGKQLQAHSGVIVDNGTVESLDRLTYPAEGEPGIIVIAVGGNTLSRGLTLEGLSCSYFARTASTYDTLMQMGRWFGFRPDYRHLVRLWTTPDLLGSFVSLNEVEEELRAELAWMAKRGLAPGRFAARIRTLPMLEVTRRAVMKGAIAVRSYSDRLVETSRLRLGGQDLKANLDAARDLVSGIGSRFEAAPAGRTGWVARDVPVDDVMVFLHAFRFHPRNEVMDPVAIESYVRREGPDLAEWNVAVVSRSRAPSTIDLGGSVGKVGTVFRSRLDDGIDGARLGTVTDTNDHRIDTGSEPVAARRRDRTENPLLLIYPIDRTSAPTSEDGGSKGYDRVALDAPEDVLGVAVCMPFSPRTDGVGYVQPNIGIGDGMSDEELAELHRMMGESLRGDS